MACILGKRKLRCATQDDDGDGDGDGEDFLLDPERARYSSSSLEPARRRGPRRFFRSVASLFGFGKKKEEDDQGGIGYQVLVKEEMVMPYQWMGMGMGMEPIGVEDEKPAARVSAATMGLGVMEQVKKKKRPRLEELLGWNVRLVEKEGLQTEIRE